MAYEPDAISRLAAPRRAVAPASRTTGRPKSGESSQWRSTRWLKQFQYLLRTAHFEFTRTFDRKGLDFAAVDNHGIALGSDA